jgi:hypothetical protein
MANNNAASLADGVANTVLSKQTDAITRATALRDTAIGIMNGMATFMPQLSTAAPAPVAPVLQAKIDATTNLEPILATSLGTITPPSRGDVTLSSLIDVPNITFNAFSPDFTSVTLPAAPLKPAGRTEPTKPNSFGTVDLPANFVSPGDPNLPSLLHLDLPTFVPLSFPTLTATPPTFEGSPISTHLQWSEVPYTPDNISAVAAKLQAMWAGGSGIPAEIENAIWERASGREDLTAMRDISAASKEFAGRGFTMPPGMLVARVDAIREDSQLKKNSLSRDAALKATDVQIENMRFACTTAIAAENVLIGIWDNTAKRQLEAAKITLDSQLAFYNAQVALFNAKQSAYTTAANIFKIEIDAELSKLQAYKMQLEGEMAKGQINEQNVKLYAEQYRAIAVKAETYKVMMEGAQIQSNVVKNKVDVYRAEIESFAQLLQSDKLTYEIYQAQVNGELAKVQVLDAQVRAYASYIQGEGVKADVTHKNNQSRIAQNELLVKQFMANVEKDKSLMAAQVSTVQANGAAHQANISRYTAQAGVQQEGIKLQIQASEAEMARSLQLYDVEIKKYIADMEQMIRVSTTQLEAMKGAGQIAATLAAGAMAGISISSNVSGNAGVSNTIASSTNDSRSRSYNFDAAVASDMPTA